jgi:hypothetical protein
MTHEGVVVLDFLLEIVLRILFISLRLKKGNFFKQIRYWLFIERFRIFVFLKKLSRSYIRQISGFVALQIKYLLDYEGPYSTVVIHIFFSLFAKN